MVAFDKLATLFRGVKSAEQLAFSSTAIVAACATPKHFKPSTCVAVQPLKAAATVQLSRNLLGSADHFAVIGEKGRWKK